MQDQNMSKAKTTTTTTRGRKRQNPALELQAEPLIVIIGAFNDKIFRDPKWDANYLFEGCKPSDVAVNINLNITDDRINTVITRNGTELTLAGTRLQIKVAQMDEYGFSEAMDIVKRLALCIPHTPIASFGVNFTYQTSLKKTNGNVLAGISPGDGWKTIESRTVKPTECGDMACVCSLENDKKLLTISFNFHNKMDGKSLTDIKNKLMDGLIGKALETSRPLAETMRRAYEGVEE